MGARRGLEVPVLGSRTGPTSAYWSSKYKSRSNKYGPGEHKYRPSRPEPESRRLEGEWEVGTNIMTNIEKGQHILSKQGTYIRTNILSK